MGADITICYWNLYCIWNTLYVNQVSHTHHFLFQLLGCLENLTHLKKVEQDTTTKTKIGKGLSLLLYVTFCLTHCKMTTTKMYFNLLIVSTHEHQLQLINDNIGVLRWLRKELWPFIVIYLSAAHKFKLHHANINWEKEGVDDIDRHYRALGQLVSSGCCVFYCTCV